MMKWMMKILIYQTLRKLKDMVIPHHVILKLTIKEEMLITKIVTLNLEVMKKKVSMKISKEIQSLICYPRNY